MEDHSLRSSQLESNLKLKLDGLKREALSELNVKRREVDDLSAAVISDYETLKEDINRHKMRREAMYNGSIDRLGHQIVQIHAVIQSERRERKESHQEIIKTIKLMRDKFIAAAEVSAGHAARQEAEKTGPARLDLSGRKVHTPGTRLSEITSNTSRGLAAACESLHLWSCLRLRPNESATSAHHTIIVNSAFAQHRMDFELTVFGLAKKWRYVNKVLGLVSAGLLITFGILNFGFGEDINHVILQIYYFVFAMLLILSECGFKASTRMFGFLGNLFGKGLFVILIGMSMFASKFDFKSIIAVVLIVCGAIYLVLFFIPRRITNDAGAGYAEAQK